MLELLKPFWVSIAKWGAIVGGILLVVLKIRQSGTAAEQRKEAMETLKGAQESAKIDNYVASVKPNKLERLREGFNRD